MKAMFTFLKGKISRAVKKSLKMFVGILFFTVWIAADCHAQVTQEWAQKFNITGSLEDRPQASVVDASGNVYVTGNCIDALQEANIVTVKFSFTGSVDWVKVFIGPEIYTDAPSAICLDNAGNVYVTGYSHHGFGHSVVIIKYNSAGTEQWVRYYYSSMWSCAITTDMAGNVYITGGSTSGNQLGFMTLKYNSAGAFQWMARYEGYQQSQDFARAIAVDGSGNIYITGESGGVGTNYDYATVKYNSSGVEQWVQRYNSPTNGVDKPTSLAIDGSGNVYVTGFSYLSGSGIHDFITIKYTSGGALQWIQKYDKGYGWEKTPAIAIDATGNVYVGGTSYTPGYGFVIIKYTAEGAITWIQTCNGYNYFTDYANALSVDSPGNIYITGFTQEGINFSYETVKFNAEGTVLWMKSYNGTGNGDDRAISVGIDGAGNVYITGYSTETGTGMDYTTVKYTSEGTDQWIAHYDNIGNTACIPRSMSVAGSGNVYVAGYYYNAWSNTDLLALKYDPAGEVQWYKTFNGTVNSSDAALATAVDGSENLYVTGYATGSGKGYDYLTIKYNSEGTEQWIRTYNGSGNSSDQATAIAVDGSGNIYVTGYSRGSATNDDFATIKYSSSGNQQWIQTYNGTSNQSDQATAIAVDGQGNIYVTGYITGSGTGNDYATLKINSGGALQWVATYNGPGNGEDRPAAIAVDESGNVYVTGYSAGSGNGSNYTTIKYDPNGVQQWVGIYNGTGNQTDKAKAIAIDGQGNVYVTGGSYGGSGTYDDLVTIKYSSDGTEEWVHKYNNVGNSPEYGNAIQIDADGYIYVTGRTYTYSTTYDYVTLKYDTAGNVKWIVKYNDPANRLDDAIAISLDGQGNIYVTGQSYISQFTTSSIATIKYSQFQVSNPPVLLSPANGSEDLSLTPLLQWYESEYATSYKLQVAEDQDFTNLVDDQSGITTTGYQLPPNLLATNTVYYWRVSAENFLGTSSWSEVWNFKTYATPQDIILEMIAIIDLYEAQGILNHGQANSLRVKLLHTLDKINSGQYDVAIEMLQAFINEIQAYINANILTPEQGEVLIAMANEVILMLQAIETIPTGVLEADQSSPGQTGKSSLDQNYPNPFTSITTISYALAKDGFTSLNLYNSMGNEVSVLVNGSQNRGVHTISFDASGLPGGVYYYRLQSGSFSATKKFIVIK